MASSVNSPADAVNLALVRIGFKKRIGSLYDGSEAAIAALTVYAQTRDELLRQYDWDFAERTEPLSLLKYAPPTGYIPPVSWGPQYPPVPWLFEYLYPADCLKVRAIKPIPLFAFNPDPQANEFSIGNDAPANAPSAPVKVLLCNVENAIIVYTGQVTNPAEWEADFIEGFAAALGRRLAPQLVGMDPAKMELQDEAASKAIAEQQEG